MSKLLLLQRVAAFLVCLAFGAGAAAAQNAWRIETGDSAGAFAEKNAPLMVRCAADGSRNMDVVISLGDFRTVFDAAQETPPQVEITIDGQLIGSVPIDVANTTDTLVVRVPRSSPLLSKMKTGSSVNLSVDSIGASKRVGLSGSSAAISHVEAQCDGAAAMAPT